MQENRIQVWERIGSPYNPQEITVAEYIRTIQEGYQVACIQQARTYSKGDPVYEDTKKTRKCFTFNFIFGNNHKLNANIIASTGLLYIDIDDTTFDVATLDKSQIFICQRSFGGKGWAILVRVDGLTLDNYSDTFQTIASELGVQDVADRSAKKATQFNVCSYDPEIFVNYDAKVFTAGKVGHKVRDRIAKEREERRKNIATQSPVLTKNRSVISGPIRYSNAADFLEPGAAYTVYPEGVYTLEAKMNRNVTEFKHNYILNLALKLVYLNPERDREKITQELFKRAQDAGIEDSHRAIASALNSAYRYLEAGTLHPEYNVKRVVIFSWEANLTAEEKKSIASTITNQLKPFRTARDILDCVVNWDEDVKITAKSIAKRLGIAEKTVQRNYKPFKAYIKSRNAELRSGVRLNLEIPELPVVKPYSVMLDDLPQGRRYTTPSDNITDGCPTIDISFFFAA
jgi:hypothetical protein